MKRVLCALLFTLSLTGCKSAVVLKDGRTYKCVGLFGDEDRLPKLHYRASTRNIVVGAVFFQMIAPPIVVALNETYCPDSIKVVVSDTTPTIKAIP